MNLPVAPQPHQPWSPSKDIAVVHDFGLLASVPLLALSVLAILRAQHARRKELERSALRLFGALLREGRVIVDVTRTAAHDVRTQDGQIRPNPRATPASFSAPTSRR
jgi:hypothetical protein